MKIALVQIKPTAGDVAANTLLHIKYIKSAINKGAGMVVFPELSLTGYEPNLAATLACDPQDPMLDTFQTLSDAHQITIGIGMPTRHPSGICISLLLFQPDKERQIYSKRYLHADEEPFFVCGEHYPVFNIGNKDIAFAICYEVFVPAHEQLALTQSVDIYLASVAKPERGVARARERLSEIARNHQVSILMVNAIGYCDNFESAGQSAVWNAQGVLLSQLDSNSEGLLVFDTDTLGIV